MSQGQIIVYRAGQGEYVEKKSRFIADIFPLSEEEEALEKIAEIKKKHYSARHHCFAYVLGEKNEIERCSDDGEPSGTAGRPILDALLGRGIHNALAVVTRYFGGTLLGTGGLVRAYSSAVKEALADCVLLERCPGVCFRIQTNYNDMGKIQYLARTMELTELDVTYADTVEMQLLLPLEKADRAEKEIVEKTAGRAKVLREREMYFGVAEGEVVLLPPDKEK